jgi:hypothetical protein
LYLPQENTQSFNVLTSVSFKDSLVAFACFSINAFLSAGTISAIKSFSV